MRTVLLLFLLIFSCQSQKQPHDLSKLSKAYFASGCFWCVEAIFESVDGVAEAISGYAGGAKETATYALVSSGMSKHAEAVEVYYDPSKVSYETLLAVFFGSHDPTTLNRQGPDRGPQYRSAIFFTTEDEKKLALEKIEELTKNRAYEDPITTEISQLEAFYKAEDYHQDYEKRNPNNSYVRAVSVPRLNKFKAKFKHLLKANGH